jgi:WD40 repeat protein
MRKAVQKNKLIVGAGGAVALALVFGTVVSTWQARRATRAKGEADQNLRSARENLYTADMYLAQQALDSGNARRAGELLERYGQGGSQDLRGFEWFYLLKLQRGESWFQWQATEYRQKEDEYQSAVLFSPNGRELAIGGDRTVQLLDVVSRRPMAPLEGHRDRVRSLTLSSDGRLLASEDAKGNIIIWDFATKTKRNGFEGRGDNGDRALGFFPDGRTLAAASGEVVRLCDAVTGQEEPPWRVEDGQRIVSMSVSPDGRRLAVGDPLGVVGLWNVESRRREWAAPGFFGRVVCLEFSPDGKTLAAGSYGGEVKVWRISNPLPVRTLFHSGAVEAMAFSRDGAFLTTASDDQTIRLWTLSTLESKILGGHTNGVEAVAFSPDSKTLATLDRAGMVKLWDTSPKERDVLHHAGAVSALAFSPDGKELATGTIDGTLQLWNVTTEQAITNLSGPTNWIWSISFSPDGRLLASGGGRWAQMGYPGELKMWDVETGRERSPITGGHSGCIYSVNFTRDSKILVAGGNDQRVHLWDIATSREIPTSMGSAVTNLDWNLHFATLSPDGQTLLWAGYYDSPAILYQIPSGRKITTVPGATNVSCAAFSPRDGRFLALYCWEVNNFHIQILDIFDHLKQKGILASRTDLSSMAFSPDGRQLAASCWDGTVTLWNLDTGHEVINLRRHLGRVTQLAFSPDGSLLATASVDKTVRLWRTDRPGEAKLDGPPQMLSK